MQSAGETVHTAYNAAKQITYSVALVSTRIRSRSELAEGGERRKRTYNGVPLEMLVDEPKGSDRGYDSEETGYNPTHIMRYEILRPIDLVRKKNTC